MSCGTQKPRKRPKQRDKNWRERERECVRRKKGTGSDFVVFQNVEK